MNARIKFYVGAVAAAACLWLCAVPQCIFAHCDTLDGPLAADARAALAGGDVTTVLKWVSADDEREVREAFEKSLVVRKESHEARELADRYFLETVVRLHRAGEGAPYTGLKPAGSMDPVIAAADKALETGSIGDLGADIASDIAMQIAAKYAAALEARNHMGESLEAGRAYVAAYIEYVHLIEAVHEIVSGTATHSGRASELEGHH